MSKILWKSCLVNPVLLGAVLAASFGAASKPAIAAEVETSAPALNQVSQYGAEGSESLSQVTSVSQLSDVQPTDWAFQALQSLVERYGVIAGYPDGRFRGNRALTRYEFAAGLNAALDRVNELIAAGTADLVTKEDLATLQKLQEEFSAELATLRGRVDALEARTAKLESQQFSTTTKLSGEVIFAVTSPLNNPRTAPAGANSNNQIVFQNRVRLALNTSFTGKDLLVTRLDAGNAGPFVNLPGGGPEATQTFNFGNTGGAFALGWLAYYFPLGDKAKVYIPATAGLQYDYAPTISPALDAFDGGSGPLSVFGQRNSIYTIGGGSGIGVNYDLSKNLGVSLGYLASNGATFAANVPTAGNGLFNGSYSALAQLTVTPSDALSVGLTYVNGYRVPGGAIFDTGANTAGGAIGTTLANTPFAGSTSVNSYGVSAAYKFSPKFVVNGWGNYTTATGIGSGLPGAEIWSYALGLGFPDLGKPGNLGGIIVGVQPYLANSGRLGLGPNAAPVHVEGFYKYQLNDNISVTPGVMWISAPGQNSANDSIVIGTLRTTFAF
ncbi:MAG: iron uptake porin [Leptolyngbyaceae bacterium]|nr:iron uptake porin [Leptolyngbyaceae bacterium]